MICVECCKGNAAGCLGITRHKSYCDNQHDWRGEYRAPVKVDLTQFLKRKADT